MRIRDKSPAVGASIIEVKVTDLTVDLRIEPQVMKWWWFAGVRDLQDHELQVCKLAHRAG